MKNIDSAFLDALLESAKASDRMRMNCDMRTTPEDSRRLRETCRYVLEPAAGNYGCMVPPGVWHTVRVLEPSVIFEAKDGGYGKDGSEQWG